MLSLKANEKRISYGQIQLGTSSLVLIFTVLCLVVFCTLSLASAKADSKLAEKNQECVMDYYEADGKAEEMLQQINESAIEFASKSSDSAQFQNMLYEKYGDAYDRINNSINFTVEVNKEQIIYVSLQLLNFDSINTEQKNYKLIKWVAKNKVDYEVDDSMPVWDGNSV